MPSDSQFAVALRNQQQAERAEQQRIKNLVLNYDLQESAADQTGTADADFSFDPFIQPNPNFSITPRTAVPPKPGPVALSENRFAHKKHPQPTGDKYARNDSLHQHGSHYGTSRAGDKTSASRAQQRARKLQLSDVDW